MDRHDGISATSGNAVDRLRMLAKLMRASDVQRDWTESNVQALFGLIEAQVNALEVDIVRLRRALKAKTVLCESGETKALEPGRKPTI